jgi:hypothetical protein
MAATAGFPELRRIAPRGVVVYKLIYGAVDEKPRVLAKSPEAIVGAWRRKVNSKLRHPYFFSSVEQNNSIPHRRNRAQFPPNVSLKKM